MRGKIVKNRTVIKNAEQDEESDDYDDTLKAYYKTKIENEEKSMKLYVIFSFLRILLTFIPQTGYIHPDELIQSIEVVGGSVLNAEVDLPWEYNNTNPIRTITIPYLAYGIPIWFLRQMNFLFDTNIITPYSIVLIARLPLCFSSFFIDYALYRICQIYSRPYHAKLTILSTSYVMLVFATRTFSNTIEMILYSIFLWMIAQCMYDHQLLVKFRKQFIQISRGLTTPRSRVKHLKILKLIEDHSLQHWFVISCLAVIGCYNRPTFVMFGAGPLFFWIHRGLSSEFVTVKDIHTRMFMFLIGTVPIILLFIFIDSAYFGYLTGPEILNFDLSIRNFVFPPWNFFKYNLNKSNLAKHGIHPFYTHLLINIPLLFGCLAYVMWRHLFVSTFRFIRRRMALTGYSRALDIDNLMRVALFAPVALLSFIPHQEPRFIVPIILPLIFLYGDHIYDIALKSQFTNTVFKLWILFNVTMTVLYGFVHQGGVYNFSTYIHKEIDKYPVNTTIHLVTSHMYSYPRVLLNQPDSTRIFKSSSGDYYQKKKRIYYYEEQSKNVDELIHDLIHIYKLSSITAKNNKEPFKIYVSIPSLLANEFEEKVRKRGHVLEFQTNIYPHLSVEVIQQPDVWDLAKYTMLHHKLLKIVSKLESFLSLNIYIISYNIESS